MKKKDSLPFIILLLSLTLACSSTSQRRTESSIPLPEAISPSQNVEIQHSPAESPNNTNNTIINSPEESENQVLSLNRDLDPERYSGDYDPKNCFAYFPWRGRPLGNATVYGSDPSGSNRLWNSVVKTRLNEVKTLLNEGKNALKLYPALTDLVTNNNEELQKILDRGSIIAVNPADLDKDLWYDIYALCGFATQKVLQKNGSVDDLTKVLEGVFGGNNFDYFAADDKEFVRSKIKDNYSHVYKVIGQKVRLQFLDSQSENPEAMNSKTIDVTKIKTLTGPIFEFIVMDVYTYHDMVRSMGVFKFLSADSRQVNYSSKFVSDMHTVWLMNNLNIMYTSATRFTDAQKKPISVPYSFHSQSFTKVKDWRFFSEASPREFLLTDADKVVVPPVVLRMDVLNPTDDSRGSVQNTAQIALDECARYSYRSCYLWTCNQSDGNAYRCDKNKEKQVWECSSGCNAQNYGDNDFCNGASESEKNEKFKYFDGTIAVKDQC